MFTSPLANKHFDFNARYIQLPLTQPMTATTCNQHEDEMEDITMTERAAAEAAPADDHGALYFMDIDQDISLWKAAYTLLDLHHAATFRHRSDQSTCATTTTSPSASSSSSSPSSSSTENPQDSSESTSSSGHSSDGGPRLRRQQRQGRQPAPPAPQQHPSHRHTTGAMGSSSNSSSGVVSKPRWSDEERNRLLMAVIEEKGLEQLTTFDWQRVARGVRNQTSTTCRARWQDHLLPLIHQLYQPQHGHSFPSSSSFSSSSPIPSTSLSR